MPTIFTGNDEILKGICSATCFSLLWSVDWQQAWWKDGDTPKFQQNLRNSFVCENVTAAEAVIVSKSLSENLTFIAYIW